jgi:hypothetical protein
VAPPFVALYRRLGLAQIGYPIDEAYSQNGDLVQDFERIELVASRAGGPPLLAPLGQVACIRDCPPAATAPVGARSGALYFPQSRHTLQGAFLRYWQQHGAQQLLGMPISEAFIAQNGDGSGRFYRMQYFTNARLELHTEIGGPHGAMLVGLLGDEAVRDRGW